MDDTQEFSDPRVKGKDLVFSVVALLAGIIGISNLEPGRRGETELLNALSSRLTNSSTMPLTELDDASLRTLHDSLLESPALAGLTITVEQCVPAPEESPSADNPDTLFRIITMKEGGSQQLCTLKLSEDGLDKLKSKDPSAFLNQMPGLLESGDVQLLSVNQPALDALFAPLNPPQVGPVIFGGVDVSKHCGSVAPLAIGQARV